MYVRNYSPQQNQSAKEESIKSENPMDSNQISIEPKEAPQTETGKNDGDSITVTTPIFGENGIKRQPLRRRKIPKKPSEHGKSPENSETPPCGTEPVIPFIAPGEPPHGCELPPSKTDKEHHHQPHNEMCSHRTKTVGCFSTEDLLLGGLILLLINNEANDDILLILAFIFISGLDFR